MPNVVVANWKQNMTLSQTIQWLAQFKALIKTEPLEKVIIVVAPPFPYLFKVAEYATDLGIFVSAQDLSTFENGSHTGKVGAIQLTDFCTYCLVGHSEIKDSKNVVLEKTLRCIESGLHPIICMIDPYPEVKNIDLGNLGIIAMEDPENISVNGSFRAKTAEEIETVLDKFSGILTNEKTVIYGGSVNQENVASIASISGINGVLVGHASLDAHNFYKICREFNK